MGYVEPSVATDGATLDIVSAESGTAIRGVVHTRAFYDPDRQRVRA
jgi:hypothetical protein